MTAKKAAGIAISLIIGEKQFDEMLAFISTKEVLTQPELIQAIRSELHIPIPHIH